MIIHLEVDAKAKAFMKNWADETYRKMLRQMAEAFGIDYATLSADYRARHRSVPALVLTRPKGMYFVPAPIFWPLRLVFHLGYNPQMLLEDHREAHRR